MQATALLTPPDSIQPALPDETLRSTVTNLKDVVFQTDAAGRWTFLNRAWEEITGFPVTHSLGKRFLDYVYPEDREVNLERFRPLIERKKSDCRHEIRYLKKNGGFCWMEVYARLTLDAEGGIAGTSGTLRDVTRHRQALEELGATRNHLEFVLANSPAVIFNFRLPGFSTTFVTPNIQGMLGYRAEEFSGNPLLWSALIHPDSVQQVRAEMRELAWEGTVSVQYRMRHKDGSWRWVLSELRRHGDREAIGCLTDISSLIETRLTLERRESGLQAAAFAAAQLVHNIDWKEQVGPILEKTGAAMEASHVRLIRRISAPAPQLIVESHWRSATSNYAPFDPAGAGWPIREWDDRLLRDEPVSACASDCARGVREVLLRLNIANIMIVPVFAGGEHWGSICLETKEPRGWSVSTRNAVRSIAAILGGAIHRARAAEQLQAEHGLLERRVEDRTAQLRESEHLYRTLVETSPDGIVFCDLQHRLRFANQRAADLLGFDSAEQMIGRDAFEFVQRGADPPGALWNVILREGVVRDIAISLERITGEPFAAEISATMLDEATGVPNFVIVTVHDVTPRQHLEEQFRQAQKMEAVGRLAGGVAHDFNNLLTVISGYSELVLKKLQDPDPAARRIRQIAKAAERGAALVQQLLAFSRKQITEPKLIQVNGAIRELEKMLLRLIGGDIVLTTELADNAGDILMDPVQFDQMLMNLVVNAGDAMQGGGSLRISTSALPAFAAPQFSTSSEPPEAYVVVMVADTGVGMSEETLGHIFEPFYTTKEVGKGTGLGLSTVYGIVKQARGHITVDSAAGRGTIFRISLPLAKAGVSHPVRRKAEILAGGGRETILVAEDEDQLRAVLTETLEEVGYTVVQARHGREALAIAERFQGTIDILITDLTMPEMGGVELHQALATRRAGIKTLFISGYSDRERPLGPFLAKPFQPAELVWQVRQLLRERAQEPIQR